ncbi:MAG: dynamin family protein [Kyrpidia sp.]|nr:dynamin family protein [Kyrpidia sp.]
MARVLMSSEQELDSMESLARLLEGWDDPVRAARVREIARKWARREVVVAFCGHFSAGKSTLINSWLGEDVLPSGPVPTTAAGVLIRRGARRIRLHFESGAVQEADGLRDWGEIAGWCTGGEHVRVVEIWHPKTPLPDGAAFLDTPGVDSADPQHQEMTEDVLHLADVVVYVMDYNHVQAEVNLSFVRRLTERGKPVFLTVNQIDKHAEYELPFLQFQYEVAQTFESLGVPGERIYYTSLRNPNHPHHQLRELQEDVSAWIDTVDDRLLSSTARALVWIAEDHLAWWRAQQRERIEAAREVLREEHVEERLRRFDELEAERRRWEDPEKHLEEDAWPGLIRTIENARITPYEIGELAGRYLESLRPGFRAGGWFRGKGRTEEERSARLAALADAFGRLLETELDRHVRTWARELAESWGVASPELLDRIDGETMTFDASWLAQQVKPGAVAEAGYAHTFVRDLASAGKEGYRKLGRRLLRVVADAAADKRAGVLAELAEEMDRLAAYARARDVLSGFRDEEDRRRSALLSRIPSPARADGNLLPSAETACASDPEAARVPVIPGPGQTGAGLSPDVSGATDALPSPPEGMGVAVSRENVGAADADPGKLGKPGDDEAGADDWLREVRVEAPGTATRIDAAPAGVGDPRFLAMAEKLRRAGDLLTSLPGGAGMAAGFRERAARLEERQFTVALFGAFSAGKSTLANALLGAAVLPSSPNPTTAAVQRVRASDAGHPHGTARLSVRSREEMERLLEDLRGSGQGDSAERIARRRTSMEPYFGHILAADWSLIRSVTVLEEWAAYLSHVDVFWDCPFTAGGWVLVDTPGVDSSHGRHTDVAFEYVRHSDAVVFVTYYNHAFSRADEVFLRQLGKVQDAFAFEKTFFVVNASDLAADREELRDVEDHVRRRLMELGLVRPRLFPVSSQGALLARAASRGSLGSAEETRLRKCMALDAGPLPSLEEALEMTGFAAFYRAFASLLQHDLADIALSQARADLERGRETVERWLAEARAEDGGRQERRRRWLVLGERIGEGLLGPDVTPLMRGVEGEIAELCDHIERRLWIRYQDRFREAFSPPALGGAGQEELAACAEDLGGWMDEELRQEWRAAALRAERWFRDRRERMWRERVAAAAGDMPGWSWTPDSPEPWDLSRDPDHVPVKETIQVQVPRLFPGIKRWIDGGMNEMREGLWAAVVPHVRTFVSRLRDTLKEWVHGRAEPVLEADRRQAVESARTYVQGIVAALDRSVAPEVLEDVVRNWPED